MTRLDLDAILEIRRNLKAYLRVDVGVASQVPRSFAEIQKSLRNAKEQNKKLKQELRVLRKKSQQTLQSTPHSELPSSPRKPDLDHPQAPDGSANLYLDLLKRAMRDKLHEDVRGERKTKWHPTAHTMVSFTNLDTLRSCIEDTLENNVPGDFIEAGAWRGGATIFMRAVLKIHEVEDRTVWVADSFEGLPEPNTERYPEDAGREVSKLHTQSELAISLEQVKSNFSKYGLLDDQVKFLKGWFSQTLPQAPIERLAMVRLDGDMYESTMDTLVSLYPKLSPGGYLIVDDYIIPACKKAIHDYREEHGVEDEIKRIDRRSVYWQKSDPDASTV